MRPTQSVSVSPWAAQSSGAPSGAGGVRVGKGRADPQPVSAGQARLQLLLRTGDGFAALLQPFAQGGVDAHPPDRGGDAAGVIVVVIPAPQFAALHRGNQRQKVIDVQRRHCRRFRLNAFIGMQHRRIDHAGRIARPSGVQTQPPQSPLHCRRPARPPPPSRRLEQRRPEDRPQPGDVVRPLRRNTRFQLGRKRVAAVQQASQAVSHQADAPTQRCGVQRRIDDGLVEARQGAAQVGVGSLIEVSRVEKAGGGREDGGKARAEAGQAAEFAGRRQAGREVGVEQWAEG